MKAHAENGLAVARFLETNPRVEKVMYPELEAHPDHQIHKKQTKGMTGMVSFYLRGGLEEAKVFFSSLEVIVCGDFSELT
jgi:cystathionine gamma-lyase